MVRLGVRPEDRVIVCRPRSLHRAERLPQASGGVHYPLDSIGPAPPGAESSSQHILSSLDVGLNTQCSSGVFISPFFTVLDRSPFMKHSALLTGLLTAAVLALAPAPATAQSVAGMWEITSETGRGTRTATLNLAVEGMTLTGTVSSTGGGRGGGGGGGGGGPQAIESSDGSIDGNSFTFTLTRTFGDNTFSQVYTGTVDGATIMGTIDSGRGGGGRPFTGKRPS